MRDIKFRAWDGKDNTMVDFGHYNFGVLGERVRNYALGFDAEGNYRNQENISYMQYTGLKDKNGKEIFEGDIYTVYSEMNSENVGKYEIKWVRAGFGPLPDEQLIQVIGNIYENPELLTKEA